MSLHTLSRSEFSGVIALPCACRAAAKHACSASPCLTSASCCADRRHRAHLRAARRKRNRGVPPRHGAGKRERRPRGLERWRSHRRGRVSGCLAGNKRRRQLQRARADRPAAACFHPRLANLRPLPPASRLAAKPKLRGRHAQPLPRDCRALVRAVCPALRACARG